MKAYKLYDIQARKVFISRDVIFHDHIFPFHNFQGPTHLNDLFPDFILALSIMDILAHTTATVPTIPNPSNISTYPTIAIVPITNPINDSPTLDTSQSPNVSSPTPHTSHIIPYTRHSSRVHHPPSYLKDYHCHLLSFYVVPPNPTS